MKECNGTNFALLNPLSDSDTTAETFVTAASHPYTMSLAQKCEHSWYLRLLNTLSDSERLRLISNAGPTQTWVTALPLAWKHWNLSSREWLIASRRRLGLDIRAKRT